MSNLRQPLYVLISVVAFLVLSVIASVEYSGNSEKSAEVKGQAFYRITSSIITTTERIFTKPIAINTGQTLTDAEMREELSDKASKYIQINKVDDGLEIILQNSEKVIWQKRLSFN